MTVSVSADVSRRRRREAVLAQILSDKAVAGGKVAATAVAELTFDAIGRGNFYVLPSSPARCPPRS